MAIITAFAVYYFASSVAGGTNNVPNVTAVVAKVDIPANTVITAEMVQTVTIPSNTFLTTMIGTPQEVVGKVCPYPIGAREYLYNTKLVALGEKTDTGLSYSLENGMRAITISVNDINGVGFFIKEGDFIDIMVNGMSSAGKPTTDLVFEKVKVIKVGSMGTPAGSNYTTLTLSVSPADAAKIVFAYTNSTLTLALRPTGDEKIVNPPPVTKVIE